MSELLFPEDPYKLAATRAENSVSHGFSMLDTDETMLQELDGGAEALGFIDSTYYVTAARSMIIPRSFNSKDSVNYTDINGLTFEGKFRSYAKVHIGRMIGQEAVRAVCMVFTDALLLPYFTTVSEEDILYVPVLAVSSIQQTNAA